MAGFTAPDFSINSGLVSLAADVVRSGSTHAQVTLSGQQYLTLSNQQITAGQINLGTTHVTGTLGIANGGTGLGTTPTSGQLLIGNSSNGYGLGTISAGSRIGVSYTGTDIQISASGLTFGTGTQNYMTKWLNGTTLTNSLVYDNGTGVGIGRTSLTVLFEIGIGDTTPLFISTGGNVGIGTTDPSYGLTLVGDFSFGNGNDEGFLRAGTDYIRMGRDVNGLAASRSPDHRGRAAVLLENLFPRANPSAGGYSRFTACYFSCGDSPVLCAMGQCSPLDALSSGIQHTT